MTCRGSRSLVHRMGTSYLRLARGATTPSCSTAKWTAVGGVPAIRRMDRSGSVLLARGARPLRRSQGRAAAEVHGGAVQSWDTHGGPGRWVNTLSSQGTGKGLRGIRGAAGRFVRATEAEACGRSLDRRGLADDLPAASFRPASLSDPAPRWNPDPPVSSALSLSRS